MNTTTTKVEDLSVSSPIFTRICDEYFYSSEWLTFTVCIYLTFQTVFWLYNLFLLYIEYNDIPWIDKYRIQKHKPKLRFQPNLVRQMRDGTIKHQISLTLSLPLLYYLLNYFGHVSVRASIPSLFTITWQIIIFVLSEDFVFFWTHYLFHTRWLYKHIHKKHHIFKQPTGVVFVLADPWESLLQNQLAVWIAPILLEEKHLFTICLWIFIRVYQTINAHSGYDLPYISAQYYFPWLLSGTLQHDYHHQHAKMNYGSFLTLWDRFMNTHRLQNYD
jgi:methylsterol monooxygenase